jgi:SAM-dependent methyltransferase
VPDPLLWDAVSRLLPPDAAHLDVLDLGGGTGGLAVPLAALGHRVTVVDPSPDALAALARRAEEAGVAGELVAIQGDADQLPVDHASLDLVLCHGVLEHVDDPAAALAAIARALRPGGRLSLVVAQRSATVIAAALSGHLSRAEHLLDDPAGRWGEQDPLDRRFDRAGVSALVTEAGLALESIHGLRILGDLVSGQLLESDPGAPGRLLALERRLGDRPDYLGLAAALHLLARAPG